MFLSKLFLPLQKDVDSEVQTTSHRLMLKAGLIKQVGAGLYTWLPLGLMVLNKVRSIIDTELKNINYNEVLLPTLQRSSIWEESGRYDAYGKEMLRITDRHGKELIYGPTAEEAMVDLVKNDIVSYKQLPLLLYNIQFKFRDEIRPRFGVMRSREFIMLDAYSFDIDEESAKSTYREIFEGFLRIFLRLGFTIIPTAASSGEIGGDLSHEFNVITSTGESEIYVEDKILDTITNYCKNYNEFLNLDDIYESLTSMFAKTDEKVIEDDNTITKETLNEELLSSKYGKNVQKFKATELGHIFYFDDKYSKSMNMFVSDKSGSRVNPKMGAYGIGPARIIASFIELNNDENGIIWNKELAPFSVIIINLIKDDLSRALTVYNLLKSKNINVLLDDTNANPGEKFAKADLIGIPVQIVISNKIENNFVEIKNRVKDSINSTRNIVGLDDILKYI
jgi:prolyl-tRNA synthetase